MLDEAEKVTGFCTKVRGKCAKKTRTMAAVDLGASSGRVILVRFDGGELSLEEVHRFPNRSVTVLGHRFLTLPVPNPLFQ